MLILTNVSWRLYYNSGSHIIATTLRFRLERIPNGHSFNLLRHVYTIGTLDVLQACDACADMGMTYSVIVQCTDCVVFPYFAHGKDSRRPKKKPGITTQNEMKSGEGYSK